MRKIYRCFLGMLVLGLAVLGCKQTASAAEQSENVDITVSAEMEVVFNEDGTNTINDFVVTNHSKLPIEITSLYVTEKNDWQLVGNQTEIMANQKRVSLAVEGQWLCVGKNAVSIVIPEESGKVLQMVLRRGAWGSSKEPESAFAIEVEYHFETKMFQLTMDSDGGGEYEATDVYNGTTVVLPKPEKFGYQFEGWKDSDGNIYKDSMVMPVGDVHLIAQWVKTDAYAIYTEEDKTLTFIRSSEPICVGDFYEGKVISKVYSDFEEKVYSDYSEVPWLKKESDYGNPISRVIVKDVIRPICTSYWFFSIRNCEYLDVTNLDMSRVTTIYSMFSGAGCDVTTKVTLLGISNWNISNITNMFASFRGVGERAAVLVFDDISGWDTSNVRDMGYMFCYTGRNANWSMDLSGWNVSKVTNYKYFEYYVEDKIIAPHW